MFEMHPAAGGGSVRAGASHGIAVVIVEYWNVESFMKISSALTTALRSCHSGSSRIKGLALVVTPTLDELTELLEVPEVPAAATLEDDPLAAVHLLESFPLPVLGLADGEIGPELTTLLEAVDVLIITARTAFQSIPETPHRSFSGAQLTVRTSAEQGLEAGFVNKVVAGDGSGLIHEWQRLFFDAAHLNVAGLCALKQQWRQSRPCRSLHTLFSTPDQSMSTYSGYADASATNWMEPMYQEHCYAPGIDDEMTPFQPPSSIARHREDFGHEQSTSRSKKKKERPPPTLAADGMMTTMMVRNLPCRITRDQLITAINGIGFEGLYDFVHLPMSGRPADKGGCPNLGYGFVNFLRPEVAVDFATAFSGYQFEGQLSVKVVDVKPAHVQGLEANLQGTGRSAARRRNSVHGKDHTSASEDSDLMQGSRGWGESPPGPSSGEQSMSGMRLSL